METLSILPISISGTSTTNDRLGVRDTDAEARRVNDLNRFHSASRTTISLASGFAASFTVG